MNKRLRNVIIGIGIAVAAAGGAVGIRTLSERPLTPEEYQAYFAVMNYEIEKAGGTIELKDIRKRRDIIDKLEAKIEAREVNEGSIKIDGESLSKKDYKKLRKHLLKRKKSL